MLCNMSMTGETKVVNLAIAAKAHDHETAQPGHAQWT